MSSCIRPVLELPISFGDYTLCKEISAGSYGSVYRAKSQKWGSDFAVKVQQKNSMSLEIQIFRSLRHPNIVKVYDEFEVGAMHFLVMEVCQHTLRDELLKGNLSTERKMTLASQIVSVVAYCHSYDVAHRDLKPENILIDDRGNVKLTDFGLSRISHEGKLSTYGCTRLYAAPEILRKSKQYDMFKADAWAVGVILHMIWSRRVPWCTAVDETMFVCIVTTGCFELSREIPLPVREVIAKALEVNPAVRISVEELAKNPLFAVNERHSLPQGRRKSYGSIALKHTGGHALSFLTDSPQHLTKIRSRQASLALTMSFLTRITDNSPA